MTKRIGKDLEKKRDDKLINGREKEKSERAKLQVDIFIKTDQNSFVFQVNHFYQPFRKVGHKARKVE